MSTTPWASPNRSDQKNDQKNKKWPEKACQIMDAMATDPSITIAEMETRLNVGHTTLKKILHEMQSEGIIRRVGPDKGGHWEVVGESH